MLRLEEICYPPIIGETYLVPCTNLKGFLSINIPVLSISHSDENNSSDHLHIDHRFISDDDLVSMDQYPMLTVRQIINKESLNISILPTFKQKDLVTELPKVCLRRFFFEDDILNVVFFIDGIKEMPNTEIKCGRCPHRGTYLKNIKPAFGQITCPAHGLRFDVNKVFGG